MRPLEIDGHYDISAVQNSRASYALPIVHIAAAGNNTAVRIRAVSLQLFK